MSEPSWLSLTVVLAIHSDQIRQHGGSLGVRDRGLLESALARPRNRLGNEPGADLSSDVVQTMLALATGALEEAGLAQWLRVNVHPRK